MWSNGRPAEIRDSPGDFASRELVPMARLNTKRVNSGDHRPSGEVANGNPVPAPSGGCSSTRKEYSYGLTQLSVSTSCLQLTIVSGATAIIAGLDVQCGSTGSDLDAQVRDLATVREWPQVRHETERKSAE